MRVVTWNLRTDTAVDPPHWPDRVDDVAVVLAELEPHVIGTQEGSARMLDDLASALPSRYAWVGEGRRGDRSDEFTAVFYDTARLELRSARTRWLSETPAVPGSTSWDAAFPRTTTTVRLRDTADDTAYTVVNTHLDHLGHRARGRAAEIIAAGLSDEPTVVLGDFNAPATTDDASGPYAVLTGAGLVDAVRVGGPGDDVGTFTSFAAPVAGAPRIDWVLVSPDLRVDAARVVVDGALGDLMAGGRHPSDHVPVLADVSPG